MGVDIDDIRDLATDASFDRGDRYFQEGRVDIIEASEKRVMARVEGTRNYTVEVDLEGGISATCTCPYDWGGYCKHIVAVLLAMTTDEVKDMMVKGKAELEDLDSILKRTDPDDLREFLLDELEAAHTMRARFLARFRRGGP